MKPFKEADLGNGKTVEEDAPKEESEEEEGQDKMFKVVIESPSPSSVKLSRKNQAHITLTPATDGEADEQE